MHRSPADEGVIAAARMPLTYSIATGIGLGFITYVLAKLIAGRFSQHSPAVIVLPLLRREVHSQCRGDPAPRCSPITTPGTFL